LVGTGLLMQGMIVPPMPGSFGPGMRRAE